MTVYQVEFHKPSSMTVDGEDSNHGVFEAQPDAQASRDALASSWVESGYYDYGQPAGWLTVVAIDVRPASAEVGG